MADNQVIIPKENNQEVWKPIPDFPGYEVSNYGNIRTYWKKISFGRKGTKHILADFPQKIRKPGINKGRYQIPLYKNNKCFSFQVHRLVMLAFVGPCPDGLEVCHNDGNSLNNHISNLRYDTRSNNHKDKYLHGTMPYGEKSTLSKLTVEQVMKIINLHKNGLTQTAIATQFNVSDTLIWKIVHRKAWLHLSLNF